MDSSMHKHYAHFFRYGVLPPSLQKGEDSDANAKGSDTTNKSGRFKRTENEEKLMEEIKKYVNFLFNFIIASVHLFKYRYLESDLPF